ncbi:MAG: hypothetical protein ABFS46_20175 [Myxococcota bacterium]
MMNHAWKESDSARRFMWAVQALALDATEQQQLYPDFADPPDELELDQQETQAAFLQAWQPLLSSQQTEAIRILDQQLEAMGGPDNARFWTMEALANAPEWARVRELATALLREMGWPLESPPKERAIYVGPPSRDK